MTLDFDARRTPHNGTDTSRAAAASLAPHVGRLEAVVLEAIREAGEHGATDDEVEIATGLAHQSVSPRRISLQRLGLVVQAIDSEGVNVTRPTRSGRKATVWIAIEERR